jgi:type I restriction enzyme S subunit
MIKKLSDICSFLSGNAWKSSQFTDEGIPIIRINNLNTNDNDFKYWQGDYDKKFLINKGDLLVSLSGTIKTFQWNGPEALLNQRIVKVTANPDTNQDWVYYQISHVIEQIANKGKHAVIRNVSINDLKNFEVDVPDFQTQNKIVAILDKANALVQKRQQTIDLLDKLLRDQFLTMFGDPAINPKKLPLVPFKNVIRKIDAGWSPVCEETSRISDDQWAVLKQGAVSKRTFIASENKLLPSDIAIKKEVTANRGDLLFSRKNTKEYVGSAAYVFEDYQKLLLPDTIFNIRYDNALVSPIYLFYLINDKNFRIIIQNLRNGAAASMPNISQTKLLELLIPLPDLTEQRDFEEFTLKLYENKKVILESLNNTSDLFQSILQRAFSGKLKFDVSVELDTLLEEIDLHKPENDLYSIVSNEEYVNSMVERLNTQDFENQDLYDKAKHAVFQLLKTDEILAQYYDKASKSLKLVVK